ENLLVAFDHVIMDGVDIISISISSDHASEYFEEPIVIGACYTMKKGILTSARGGNDRCSCRGMVDNVATLMLVSYVNSIDLRFINTLVTGDRRTIVVSCQKLPNTKSSAAGTVDASFRDRGLVGTDDRAPFLWKRTSLTKHDSSIPS
ncbi:hypothetical protein B296_00010554, partial [Ensete ventricosum]